MRVVFALLCIAGAVAAQGRDQIAWVDSLDRALEEAKTTGKPVMVCINAKEGESANEHAARRIYKDPEFVERSRDFVMVVVAVNTHGSGNPCERFGGLACNDHLNCYLQLKQKYGKQFIVPGTDGEMISPQHAWFEPDGTLLMRREYALPKDDLLSRMKLVNAEVARLAAATPSDGKQPQADERGLLPKDRVLLGRVQCDFEEMRRGALDTLMGTRKHVAQPILLELAGGAPDPVLCDLLRAFGRAGAVEARELAEGALASKNARVRSFAAVALEGLAQQESIPLLVKRAKAERDPGARKNIYRALGACGGLAGDKKAAQQLLKGLKDRDKVVAKHAALAASRFKGTASKLVLKKLEKAVVSKKSSDFLRAGLVYSLGRIGNTSSTVKALRKAYERSRDNRVRAQIRRAIDRIQGNADEGREVPSHVFWEDREDDARDA